MLRVLFLIPSCYGFILFSAGYILYAANTGEYEEASPELHLICVLVILAFGLATLQAVPDFVPLARRMSANAQKPQVARWPLIAMLHAVGLIGIGLYFQSLVGY